MLPPNLYARVHISTIPCTRDRGCGAHPVFPAPSISMRANEMQSSGKTCREIAKSYSVVIVREGGRSSIPETSMIKPIGRGVLDPRLRGDDGRVLPREETSV